MPLKSSPIPSTSVIIPAYNAEKTLPACLDALLDQTIHPSEIIVVDDGSTDGTKTVAEAYSLVTLLSQSNQGPARARNNGAKAATGKIILFIDSDCVPEKNWLEEMIKPFSDEKVVGVQGAYKTKQQSLTARFEQADIEYRYEHMKHSKRLDWIGSYSAAYRRKSFLEEGSFDEHFPKASGEDAELSYRLAEKGYVLAFNPNAIVYHTHPSNLLHYLRVKFFRAYWRVRMYSKYPKKMAKDSYTPNELKLNVILGGAFLASVVWYFLAVLFLRMPIIEDLLLLWIPIFYWIFVVVLTFTRFLLLLIRNDPALFLFSFLIIPFRSIVFFLGLLFGMLDRRVRA